MKSTGMVVLLALWQGGFQNEGELLPAPEHFHYQRAIQVPAGASGQACAVLDPAIFAHADAALNAVRLYSQGREIPFVVTKSGEGDQDVEDALVLHRESRDGKIVFDLKMPDRSYTEVDLDLAGKDFYATATVSGVNSDSRTSGSGAAVPIGKYALFDLTSEGLGRSLTLPLQEEKFSQLHIELTLLPARADGVRSFDPEMVRGAKVPPTREAQSIYTTIAETHHLEAAEGHPFQTSESQRFQAKGQSVAFLVPAHVPVERVTFRLKPGFEKNFLRHVQMKMKSAESGDSPDEAESIGEIQRVILPGIPGGPRIEEQKLSLPIETMSNVRGSALMEITVEDAGEPPLPLDAVALEMRQREVCFEAEPDQAYELRYGDDAPVSAPVYDYAASFRSGAATVSAILLPEAKNTDFVPRRDERSYRARHPELLWIGFLAIVALLGASAIHGVKGQGGQKDGK